MPRCEDCRALVRELKGLLWGWRKTLEEDRRRKRASQRAKTYAAAGYYLGATENLKQNIRQLSDVLKLHGGGR